MRNHTAFNVVAEIEYINEDLETIHSDIGPGGGDLNAALTVSPDFRQYLHDHLDEWLDKSDGTGIFYVTGDPEQFLKSYVDEVGDTYAIEKVLNDRIDHLEAEIDRLKRQMTAVFLRGFNPGGSTRD
jgi:hypothetical protein